MLPADECFHADNRFRVEVELGLVIQDELLIFQGAAQIGFYGMPFSGKPVHVRIEKLVSVAALLLGVVHRGIGIPHQGFGVLTVIGINADPDACGRVQLTLDNVMGRRERGEYLVRGMQRIFRTLLFHQHDNELVAAVPTDCVGGANTGCQTLRNGFKQLFADRMPKGIVDRLEVVQIEEQHGKRVRGVWPKQWRAPGGR